MGIYEAYYDCRSEPFSLSPDPRFLYLSPTHREALAQLRYVVEMRKGFAVLTGEVGLGKTILLRTLLQQVRAQVRTAYMSKPPRSVSELYAAIGQDWGLSLDSGESPIFRLNVALLETYRAGGTFVLVFDEAQQLPIEVLEEIRLISNLEAPDAKLVQVILAGQPELETLLEKPELRALRQRVVMWHTLTALSLEDTVQYISSRVRIAGARRSPFTLEACRAVHRLSRGVPRLINLICDKAMLLSYASDSPRVDRRCVESIAEELRLTAPPSARFFRKTKLSTTRWGIVSRGEALKKKLAVACITLFLVLLTAACLVASRHYFTNRKSHRLFSPDADTRAHDLTFSPVKRWALVPNRVETYQA